jgi:hypothetical protein
VIRRVLAVMALSATPLAASAVASIAYAAGGTTDMSFGSGSGFAAVTASDTNTRFFAAPTGEPVITTEPPRRFRRLGLLNQPASARSLL